MLAGKERQEVNFFKNHNFRAPLKRTRCKTVYEKCFLSNKIVIVLLLKFLYVAISDSVLK